MRTIAAVTLVQGEASGPILSLSEPLSFWGGFDIATGRVIDRHHPDVGACLAGRILVMRAGRGSSSGSSVLAEAIRRATAPAAIVLAERDPIVTTGALVARALYEIDCPVVLVAAADWPDLTSGITLTLSARRETAELRLR